MVCSSNRLIIPLTRGWVQAPPLKIVVCFGVCNLMIIQLLNSALERYHSFFNYPIYSLLTKSRYFTLPRRIIVGQLSSSAIESSWLSSSEKSVSSKQHVATVYIEFCSACVFVRFVFCFLCLFVGLFCHKHQAWRFEDVSMILLLIHFVFVLFWNRWDCDLSFPRSSQESRFRYLE